MSFINLIKTALYSIRAHKIRVFLTMIGIIIGISSVVTILSIGDGIKKYIDDSSNDNSMNNITISFEAENKSMDSSLMEPFTESDIDDISNISGVEKVKGINGNFSFSDIATYAPISFSTSSTGYSYIYKYNNSSNLDIMSGRGFESGDSQCIILSYDDCMTLFDNVDDAIGKGVAINNIYFEIIGVLNEIDDYSISTTYPYTTLLSKDFDSISNEKTTITSLSLALTTNVDRKEVAEQCISTLKDNHPELLGDYQMEDLSEATKFLSTIVDSISGFIAIISGISLFVAGIGVMNIMYVSISERKREIGIRRAIGAYPNNILLQFLLESVLVTFIGGLIGLGCGILFAKLIGLLIPYTPILTLRTILISTITSILTGIIFGVIPARKAANMPPIQAIYN